MGRCSRHAALATAAFLWLQPSAGNAQLDRLLAPLPTEADLAEREAKLVGELQSAPEREAKLVEELQSAADRVSAPSAAHVPADEITATVIGPDDFTALLEKQIADHFSITGELKLNLVRQWQPLKVTPDFELLVTEYPAAGVTPSFIVSVRVKSAGKRVGEWHVPLRAQLWREVWVAAGRLNRGQQLDRSLLAVRKVDVLRERETLVPADIEPEHYDLAQSVAAGRPLAMRDIAERPLVRKGDVVEVIASQGALSITMKALALENGGARDMVRLRNLDSRKEFTAQIINENTVQVHF